MAKFCENCGRPIEEGAGFCASCAAAASENPASTDASSSANGDSAQASAGNDSPGKPLKKTKTMAVVSLVFGILSIVTGFVVVGIVFGAVAIALSVVSKRKNGNSGIGLAGLITGIVGIVMSLIMIVAVAVVLNAASNIEAGFEKVGQDYLPVTATEQQILGEWKMATIYIPEEEGAYDWSSLTEEQLRKLEQAGENAKITFFDNGRYHLEFSGYLIKGEWVVEDYYVHLDPDKSNINVYVYYFDRNGAEELTMINDEVVVEFVRLSSIVSTSDS